jgi:predicted nucleotidyltransferase component of viral defense system
MVKWLALPDATRKNSCEQTAEARRMSAFAVEKDWWITQTLSIIIEMKVASHMVFKGGTSLSKSWKLIERLSEDIDLAIDRSYFGFTGELSKKQKTGLRKAANAFTSGPFLEEMTGRFAYKGYAGLSFKLVESPDSDQDPRIIEIYYPNLIIPVSEYVQPKIAVEIGCRSLREPYTIQPVTSLIDEYYRGSEFTMPGFGVPSVNPERTFLEKLFLLHEEFHRPAEKIRVDRLSRHLYDVYCLSKTDVTNKALNDSQLYENIVEHRFKYTRLGGVNYNLHQPQTLNPLPVPEVQRAWRNDYNTMLEEMIYAKNPPEFDEVMEEIQQLTKKINALEWGFTQKFPVP